MSELYNSTAYERAAADFYQTPPDLARALPDGLAVAGIALHGPILEPCCGDGALASVLAHETGLNVIGSDLYPERYPSGLPFYATTEPTDARDPNALASLITATGARSAITNPPYGKCHALIAKALLSLIHDGVLDLAALLVPHQFDAASTRSHLFTDPHCALRVIMPWRPEWIAGTGGNGTISSVWWCWTREPRTTAGPVTVIAPRRRHPKHGPSDLRSTGPVR